MTINRTIIVQRDASQAETALFAQESREARDQSREFAEIAQSAGGNAAFPDYASALAAAPDLSAETRRISWIDAGHLVEAVRVPLGPLLSGGWGPAAVATPPHFGDSLAAAVASAAVVRLDGDYSSPGLSVSGRAISGQGKITRSGGNNLMTSADADDVQIKGVTLDMDRATQPQGGQGVSLSGQRPKVEDVTVLGFGRTGTGGGGTGALAYSADMENRTSQVVFENLRLIGSSDVAGVESFGWIFADVDGSRAAHIYAENIIGNFTSYGHELKNTSSYNNLHALTTKYGLYGYGHGQQFAGLAGPKCNVGWGIVNANVDRGNLFADGKFNLIGGSVTDWNDSLGRISKMGLYLAEEEEGSAFPAHLVHGLGEGVAVHVRAGSVRNYIGVIAQTPNATKIVEFVGATTQGNAVDVHHTGTRTSIIPYIVDTTGNGYRGAAANVINSPSTGERVGSRSGGFHDKLGLSGASPLSSHHWRREGDQYSLEALMVPGNAGDLVGLTAATAVNPIAGVVWWTKGATVSADFWKIGAGGNEDALRVYADRIQRGAVGGPGWYSGTGAPNGAISAPPGSFYSRTDGGAGSTFYVKETGTGNTGWAAK